MFIIDSRKDQIFAEKKQESDNILVYWNKYI